MAIVALPVAGLKAIEWTEPPRAAWATKSSWSGKQTVIDRGGITEGWRADVKVAPREAAGVWEWRRFHGELKGKVNTVRIPATEDQASCPVGTATISADGRRYNLFVRSNDFANASWTKSGTTVGAAFSTTSDAFTDTAWPISENSANVQHLISQNVALGGAANITFSVWLKASGRTWAYLTTGTGQTAWFNLSAGTVGTSNTTAAIVAAGNGWFRCSITYAASAGTVGFFIGTATGDNVASYLGTGIVALQARGAQLEYGSRATTFINTTTAIGTSLDGFLLGGLTNGVTYLRAGQLITLLERLFILTEDLIAGPGGIANASISPDLPRLTVGGEVALLRFPTCTMRLADGQRLGWGVDAGPIYQPFNLTFDEAL